jgi:hypothetical protein
VEKLGIPSIVITRQDFSRIVAAAYGGLGFPVETPSTYEFPMGMFLPGSDLSPIRENIDKIVYGLTKWEPKRKQKGTFTPTKIKVEGKDYQEAFTNLNNLFLKNMWGDGLPILPATEDRVNWILMGTDLPRDKVISKILPRGGIATVETLAVALAMAGGRPEYLPVFIASVEAFTEPEFRHDWLNTTTGSVYPGIIVNGPAAKQVRLNSGYSFLGPHPSYPAGATIGRALRLLCLEVGGAIPGIGSMSLAGVNRFTNMVFAEDEGGIPTGWKPLSVVRGFPKDANVVTVVPADDYDMIFSTNVNTEESLRKTLDTFGGHMGHPTIGPYSFSISKGTFEGMAIMPRGVAAGFARLGWSEEDVRKGLWESSKVPWSEIERRCSPDYIKKIVANGGGVYATGKPWPLTRTPEEIMIVVAGGEQSGHASWIRFGGASPFRVTSKEIQLPKAWSDLLKRAEADLGPAPAD